MAPTTRPPRKKGRSSALNPSSVPRQSMRPLSPPTHRQRTSICGGGWKRLTMRSAVLAFSIIFLLSVAWRLVISSEQRTPLPPAEFYTFEVVNVYPHDPYAFTQGLLYVKNDTLYESTGLNGRSSVRKVHLQSGKVQLINNMDASFFGEGLTLFGERLFQVTWLTKTGFIYNMRNLKEIGRFTHQMTDGWGLATDEKVLFGSDGTSSLYRIDPHSFKVINSTTVRYKGREVHDLNELEYIHGEVWANVWQTDCIARISRDDGRVLSWILLPQLRQSLIAAGHNGIDVLNGIAWDEDNKRLFVTGKWWPKLYEIKLIPIMHPRKGLANQCLRRNG